MKIAAVVVTFNRKDLLVECISALMRQTRPLDAIYLVDNASTDGTPELLAAAGFLSIPILHYRRQQHNVGGSGGFHDGMQAAFADGHDWIWVMDDDAEPHEDALVRMVPYCKHPEVVGVSCQKVAKDGSPSTSDLVYKRPKQSNLPYRELVCAPFVGFMLSRRVIESVGLPRAEFFIHHDDSEYCRRILTVGAIVLAEDSIIVHKVAASAGFVQRHFMGKVYTRYAYSKFCFSYFDLRNRIIVEKNYMRSKPAFTLKVIMRFWIKACQVILLDKDRRWGRLCVLAKANLDGVRERYDNEYPFRLLRR